MANQHLREEIEQLLLTHRFPSNLISEEGAKGGEPSLQTHVANLVRENVVNPNPDLKMVVAVGGEEGTAPSVHLLGTEFCPDIAIECASTGEKCFALELKLVKAKGRSSAITSIIGQCVINKMAYADTIGFILVYNKDRGTAFHEFDNPFKKHLENLGIRLIIKTPG